VADVDIVVVGAGVTGLAVALDLARKGRSVCVLDRNPRPGMETSTHNSGVIHAGLYHPTGSLKSKLCVEGRERLYSFCEEHGVPYRRCGKLVVGDSDADVAGLERLAALGVANGVQGLTMVDQAFVAEREPHVHAPFALWSPESGVVEAEALVRQLATLCDGAGVMRLPASPLLGAEPLGDDMALDTPRERIVAPIVVNAAGLFADSVSAMLGGQAFRIYPCRGEYAELVPSRRSMVRALVYPLPHPKGHSLGVHLSKTTWGSVLIGPTVHFQEDKDDYESDRLPIEDFYEPTRMLLPELRPEDIRLGGSGIRPKLHGPEGSFEDFVIGRDTRNPHVVQVSGIDSPGLTSCLAIGEMVTGIVGGM
jgi:L-2-hydroxyglutarate oxidase LhgO